MAQSGPDLPERVKFGGARVPEQPVPRIGADSHHAGEIGFEVTKFNSANQRRQVRVKRPHGCAIVRAQNYSHNQEDRSASERSR